MNSLAIYDQTIANTSSRIHDYSPGVSVFRQMLVQVFELVDLEIFTQIKFCFPDQHVTIVDFDLLCRGNPAVDVGNLFAHLIERSLHQSGAIRMVSYLRRLRFGG